MRVINTLKRMIIAKQKGDPKPNGRVAVILHGTARSAQTDFNPIRRLCIARMMNMACPVMFDELEYAK